MPLYMDIHNLDDGTTAEDFAFYLFDLVGLQVKMPVGFKHDSIELSIWTPTRLKSRSQHCFV